MPKKTKHFIDWLTKDPQGKLIIKGTEEIDRYPNGPLHGKGYFGVREFGCQKVDGITCMKVSAADVWILINLGWVQIAKRAVYSYVVPPDCKPEASK